MDRQAVLWEVRRRLAAQGGEAARRKLAHLEEGPWVTVSKQMGAGGRDLSHRVADRLGWQVFDREILEAIARETHTREKVLSRLDGRAVGILEDYLSHLLVPGDPGQPAFVHEMTRVIWTLGREGNAVLVGRGANWVLEPRFGLRIRLVAPFDMRLEAVAEAHQVDSVAARRLMDADEASQTRFIRQVYRRDIDDPLGYDLVINRSGMNLDAAADLVLISLERKLGAGA